MSCVQLRGCKEVEDLPTLARPLFAGLGEIGIRPDHTSGPFLAAGLHLLRRHCHIAASHCALYSCTVVERCRGLNPKP